MFGASSIGPMYDAIWTAEAWRKSEPDVSIRPTISVEPEAQLPQ